jgi:high mobility group protein B3
MRTKNETFDKLVNKIENLDINDKDKKELIKLTNNIKKSNEKNKKIKDPNQPRRPKNGFMLLMDDVRKIKDNKKPSVHFPSNRIDDIKIIIDNNKDKPITELSKSCGVFWKDVKDEEKTKYENTYKKSYDKYKKEMEKYKKEKV